MAAPSRTLNVGAWVASALLFVLYTVVASPPKLMGNPQAVEGFIKFGYSDGFRLFIGACEFLGGIALLVPRLAFWSAIGLAIIMIGAMHTQLSHDDAAHVALAVIAFVLLLFIAYVRRGQAVLLS